MAKQTREQLGVQPNDKIILKGRVTFARLDKAVTGEALAKENERRAKLGMLKTKEFRSVTIEEPVVVQGQDTPLANFHAQEVYNAKASGKPTMSFESKSLYPPQYGHMQENGAVQEMEDPQKNPAQGQEVYLMISAFAPKGFNNLGSTFDAIVFPPGEIQFYEGKANNLAGFGQAMNMPVQPLGNNGSGQPQPTQEPAPQEQPVGVGAGAGAQNGFNGFGQAPTGDPNQTNQSQNGFGGFGQTDQQGQNGFGQQPQQGQDGAAGPFNQGSPFGNNGQRGQSPYA